MFKPLSREHIEGIVEILISRLKSRLAKENLILEVTDRAKDYIACNGYDSVYGARPLKRFLQSRAETLIARYIVSHNPSAGSKIVLDEEDDGLILKA